MKKKRLGYLPVDTKALAGFLLPQSRNKTTCILRSYVILALFVLFLAHPAFGIEVSSGSYALDLITFLNAGGSASSANNSAEFTALGEGIVSIEESLSTKFRLLAGQLYLLFTVREEEVKLISDLKAREDVLGKVIPEATWQKDNDPYFYWEIKVEPAALITGFSVSLDTPADTTIDTTVPFYLFSEHSIASGKHTFYVLPFTAGNIAEENSLLKFDFWADADTPAVNQFSPSPGESVSSNTVVLSCFLYDADSGIDENLTTLTLNNSTVYFTYDPQTQLLKFSPDTSLPEGENMVLLRAYDVVGNYLVKGWNFIVDTQGPSGSVLLNNGEEITHSAYVFINIKAEDAVSKIQSVYISNDGVFDTEMNHPYPYSPIISNWLVATPDVDGLKTVYVKFADAAGNFSGVYKDQITLKLKTPDTRIISGPTVVTPETAANFQYEASRPLCQFSYKLDNLNWSEWSNATAASFKDLSDSNHYFYAKSAFDLNGDGKISIDEEDATPAQWVWAVKPAGKIEEAPRRILFWRR